MILCSNNIERKSKICRIKNYGYNCYINSGLQILSRIEKLVNEIKEYNGKSALLNELKNTFNSILYKNNTDDDIYDPIDFIKKYLKYNNELEYSQNCSQSFIRRLIYNINQELIKINPDTKKISLKYLERLKKNKSNYYSEYNTFLTYLEKEKIIQQSTAFSLFSVITKSFINDFCEKCGKKIYQISYNQFIDQNLYLDSFQKNKKIEFLDALNKNIGKKYMNLTMNCTFCNKEIKVKEETKIVKLPEILIFTLERYIGGINNMQIINNRTIDMEDYLDNLIKNDYKKETEYELFAINIRYGSHYGHQICQIIDNNIYEINDTEYQKIKESQLEEYNSYGLFYKRITHKNH